jgi:type I restriction enzyme S subunit
MKWETKKFIDFIKLQRGHDLTQEQFVNGSYPVVSSTSIMGYHKEYKAEAPGVVIGRSGTLGKVQFINENYWPHNTSLYVKDFKGNSPRYVYYFLCGFETNKHGGGSAVPTLNRNNLSSIDVCVPDVSTQHRIADILSAYDDLIENNQKQIKLLEEASMRLYKEWFVDLRFPGHENTPIVDGVPEGWEKKQLSEIADVVMGQSPKSEFYNTNGQGLPFHQGVTNYGDRFVINETYTTSYTRIAIAGSILFSVRAPVGRMNITKEKIAIGRGLSSINHKLNLQSLLFYMLKERFYKDNLIGNGAIYASITKDELYSQLFLIPTNELSCKYNEIVSKMDRKLEALDSQVFLLKLARDKLLPKLISGEIEV